MNSFLSHLAMFVAGITFGVGVLIVYSARNVPDCYEEDEHDPYPPHVIPLDARKQV